MLTLTVIEFEKDYTVTPCIIGTLLNPSTMLRIFALILITTLPTSLSYARVGDSEQQDAERYGPPVKAQDSLTPILKNGVSKTYHYQGWKIRVGYLDGTAVRVSYAKMTQPETPAHLKDDEIDAILNAEAHGGKWEKIPAMSLLNQKRTGNNLFDGSQRRWVNTNGSIAYVLLGNKTIFVESPDAGKWEQRQERAKEEQRKGSIPKF